MARAPRILIAGGLYHVIARGNNKMRLFHDGQDFRVYRRYWIELSRTFSLRVLRYTLMSNHIHLLIEQINDTGLPEAMQSIQMRYAKYFGKRYKWVGHVWQGRYKSPLIGDEGYLEQCGQYIENNPVRAGLVDRPEDYPWSSARTYSCGLADPVVGPEAKARFSELAGRPNVQIKSVPSSGWEQGGLIGERPDGEKVNRLLKKRVWKPMGRPKKVVPGTRFR